MSKRVLTAVVLAGVMMTSGAAFASVKPDITLERREPPKELKGQRPPMMSRDKRIRQPMTHNNKPPKVTPDRRLPERHGVEPRR